MREPALVVAGGSRTLRPPCPCFVPRSEQVAMPGGVTDTVLTPRPPRDPQDPPQGLTRTQSHPLGLSQAGAGGSVARLDSRAVFSGRQQLGGTPVSWLSSAAVPGACVGSGLLGQVLTDPTPCSPLSFLSSERNDEFCPSP